MTKENADSKVAPGAEAASSLSVRQAEQRFFARRIIAGGLAVAAGIVIIAGLLLWNLRAETVATARADLDSFDLLLAAQTERTFENVDLIVSGIAEEFRADGVDSRDKLRRLKGNDATYRLLREKLAGVPQLDALLIIDAKGDVINVS